MSRIIKLHVLPNQNQHILLRWTNHW